MCQRIRKNECKRQNPEKSIGNLGEENIKRRRDEAKGNDGKER